MAYQVSGYTGSSLITHRIIGPGGGTMKKSLANHMKRRLDRAAEQDPEERARALIDIRSDLERFRKNPHIDRETLAEFEEDIEQRLAKIDDHVTATRRKTESPSLPSRIAHLIRSIYPWSEGPPRTDEEKAKGKSSSFSD